MNFDEIKKLPKDELQKKMAELKLELMKLSAQVAIGTTPKNTKQIREIKKTIARVETLHKQAVTTEIKSLHSPKKYTRL
ncbi:MAG: 50S ribosomal protein L29 [Candidatus Woesearchaeota archaeon]